MVANDVVLALLRDFARKVRIAPSVCICGVTFDGARRSKSPKKTVTIYY